MDFSKPVKWRSKEYLSFIRSLPCCVCGLMPGGIAHHESVLGEKGIGTKPGDEQSLPICPRDHTLYHNGDNWTRMHMPQDPAREMLRLLTRWLIEKEGK